MNAVDSSDVFIPPGSTCHVVDYSSAHSDVAVCVPGEGLIVLQGNRVVEWCDIENKNVERIAIFFTYQPDCKHYVLQLPYEVKVVSYPPPLKVTHTYKNVERFEIGDFRNKGFPQLGLWKSNAKSVCITDLTAASCSSPSTNPVENVLHSKVRGLKLSADRIRQQLEAKRRLRRHSMFNILGTNLHDAARPSRTLIAFVGKSLTSCKETLKSFDHSLIIHHSWQRLLCKKWVLGCDVQNISSHCAHKDTKKTSICLRKVEASLSYVSKVLFA